ncbi:acyl-CoA thioesterase [Streptomyces sp. NPDC003011]
MTENPAADPPGQAGAVAKPFRNSGRVHFDELDPMGILHNARYQVHAERGVSSFFESQGFRWTDSLEVNPDRFHAVRRFEIDFHLPFAGEGPLDVEVWLERLGRTSISHGFACIGDNGTVHASGMRAIVRLDSATYRPLEWTEGWRKAHLTGLLPERSA